MKKELLSPAGDMDCLKAAIHGGCDAVYIGGKRFGARASAANFDEDELLEAVNYCHIYGVKLYVTVNTMIHTCEMKEVLDYVGFLYSIHVDAVIVQDIGLIWEIQKWYPNLEIHASTQLHNTCQESFQLLENIGVKRVVLARELTLTEISHISTTLEKEVFIHGAICISYSGQCLFSSLVMGRSGNRGECAGMCRLPYSLEKDDNIISTEGKYLLSPKELSTIDSFQQLMESDITCFKIEGRMKSPAYVYMVTKIYRMLMDHYEKGEKLEISKEDFEQLQVLYNREFTEGHLFEKCDFDLMNIKSPNHIGISLGKVVEIKDGKLKILLTRDLHQEDGIRFVENGKGMIVNFLYDQNGQLIREEKSGNFVWIDNKVGLTRCSIVRKTSDKMLLEQLKDYPLKKILVSMKCVAYVDQPLKLELSDGNHTVSSCGDILEKAVKQSTCYDDIVSHLNRLGNTPYALKDVDILMDDNIFIPMSKLNELRRDAIAKLDDIRIFHKTVERRNCYELKSGKFLKKNVQICCLVRTEEQLQALIGKSLARIYVSDFNLYKKYHEQVANLYYRQKRVSPRKACDCSLITEFSQLNGDACITDYYLNVANPSYLQYLETKNVKVATLSVELDVEKIASLAKYNFTSIDLEVLVYGRVELMIMKHCPLRMLKKENNKPCQLCKDSYFLVDRNQEKYPLVMESGVTHLFSYQKQWFSDSSLQLLASSGISFMRLEFFDESAEEIVNILEKYQQLLQKFGNCDKIEVGGKG